MDNPFYKACLPVTAQPFVLLLISRPFPPLGMFSQSVPATLRRSALWLCMAGVCTGVVAQEEEEEGLQLRFSARLEEKIPPAQGQPLPIFLSGERIEGHSDRETVLEGDATLRKPGTVIRADRLEYDQPTDRAKATGNVRVNRAGNLYEGPLLDLEVEAFKGHFEKPTYQFLQNDAHGEADRAEFIDENHMVAYNATYTTCRRKPGPDWMPDWILRATSIELDAEADEGIAHGGVLSFKGVPILPVPAISFPLSDKRKSGFLPPTLETSNVSGVELVTPYYWNIAPNRDATITPTLMTSRGVDLGVQFRYLEPDYTGTLRTNYMPGDKLRGADRWALSFNQLTGVPTPLGVLGVSTNINRVSDDNYWRDFPRAGDTLTQRILPSSIAAAATVGPLSTSVQFSRWQTLQDVTAPIVPPYDRVPQLMARYAPGVGAGGLEWSVDADFTQFEADRSLTLQPNAQRSVTLAQVSRPWQGAAGFITPKLQLHAAAYQFDAALANGTTSASSVVPTFSLDSGLVFEREVGLLGRNMRQTLEPRAFYVYTPFRNQSLLPNYDTAANDFNFATIYTENAFVGRDKVSDNNMLTLGLTTRFFDADSGAQLARFGVAQRLRFEDQQVTINSATPGSQAGFSDVLLGASLNLPRHWAVDSTVQYNPKTDESVRNSVGVRYHPGSYRVINTAYRFQRDLNEQVDVSWQWPLNNLWGDTGKDLGPGRGQGEGRYYSVGRLNYSLNEQRLVDLVLGVEYDAGCWLGRVVMERVQNSISSATQRLMFQLEFVGFARVGLGASPQQSLTQNISRYQQLRESFGSTSRFSNYD
jgi:LPS-assembly protein